MIISLPTNAQTRLSFYPCSKDGSSPARSYPSPFNQARLHPGWLSAELIRLPGTVEIVVHAGLYNDPTFPANVPYAPEKRAAEKQYLEQLYPLLNGTD